MNDGDSNAYAQADAISLLIEHASELQQNVGDVLLKVSGTQQALAALPLTVRGQVLEAILAGLAKPAEDAGNRMAEQLQAAIGAADGAARSMVRLERAINRKFMLTFLALTILAVLAVTAVASYIGMTPWQLNQRRDELAALQSQIEGLRASGADAELLRCQDARRRPHLCVKVDPKYGDFGSGVWVVKGL